MVPKVPLRTRPKPRLREVGVLVMNVLCCVAHRNIHLDKKVGIDIWNRTHRDRYKKKTESPVLPFFRQALLLQRSRHNNALAKSLLSGCAT